MYRKSGLVFVVVVVLCFIGGNAFAQGKFPERPIQALVSYPAGGSVDTGARIIAEFMQKYLKQPVVVVNKPGAGSALAGNELFRSKPDGYTIGMFTSGATTPESGMNPDRFLYKQKELQGVAQWSGNCTTLISKYDAPWKNLKEFVNYAKENPSKLKWSHQGRGNRDWMVGTLIIQKAGIKMLDVPSAGAGESMAALLGNNIDMAVTSFGSMIMGQMDAKKIQVLGFDMKLESQPDIPSFKELGYDLNMPTNYIGTFVPRGVPAEVIAKLNEAILNATKDPEVRAKFTKMGMPVWYNNGKDLDQLVDDFAKFQLKTLKELGVL
jgi:tripartite-type tricarboxylate transporter receptor subunit TctC